MFLQSLQPITYLSCHRQTTVTSSGTGSPSWSSPTSLLASGSPGTSKQRAGMPHPGLALPLSLPSFSTLVSFILSRSLCTITRSSHVPVSLHVIFQLECSLLSPPLNSCPVAAWAYMGGWGQGQWHDDSAWCTVGAERCLGQCSGLCTLGFHSSLMEWTRKGSTPG